MIIKFNERNETDIGKVIRKSGAIGRSAWRATMRRAQSLRNYLRQSGLKVTRQRQEIAESFLKAGRHLSAEELYGRIHQMYPEVGLSTVYRTLKILVDAGLASPREFGDGITRYEPRSEQDHHDHLICVRCGAIIEFENQKIEALQKEVAELNRFTVIRHRLELYGYCDKCRQSLTQVVDDRESKKRHR
jgi:Fur family ferric uptake transcriptional regulator